MKMKKIGAFLLAAFTAAGTFVFPASAAEEPEVKLPFELTAPNNVSMVWLEGNDSENTIEIHYSQNNSMSDWSSRKSADHDTVMQELNDMGYDDVWINTQIDWSIDTQDDWKADEYWLTGGYDEDFRQHLGDWAWTECDYSEETSMSTWIFRWMGNIDDPEDPFWYGVHNDDDNIKGWKDVLKEGQYDVIKGEDESHAKINLDEHTIYTRVRWLVTCRPLEGEDIHITSDGSEIAAIGKDAVKVEPLKPGDIAAPVISDLRYTGEEFNGFPVIGFKLAVDDTLASQVTQVSGTQGGISIEVEARLKGKEEWVGLQGDWIVKAGEQTYALQHLAEAEGQVEQDAPIELRARYRCDQIDQEEFWSDYSEILTFGSEEMEVVTTTPAPESIAPEETTTPATTTTAEEKEEKKSDKKDKCSLCGFCPQPLGLCIFIWIAIIVAIVVIIIIIVVMKKKKDNKPAETPAPAAPAQPAAPPADTADNGNGEENK